MTTASEAARRFRYHFWATARLTAALEAGQERATAYLAHACTSDRVWLDRLRGEPTAGIELWPTLEPGGVRELARTNEAGWTDYLTRVDDHALASTVAYTNTKGESYTTPVGDIIEHVLLHGAYHRGQAAAAIRAAGSAPPATDFIVWVRVGG
jgi:uncharacterized damage-inducible protein DinB